MKTTLAALAAVIALSTSAFAGSHDHFVVKKVFVVKTFHVFKPTHTVHVFKSHHNSH